MTEASSTNCYSCESPDSVLFGIIHAGVSAGVVPQEASPLTVQAKPVSSSHLLLGNNQEICPKLAFKAQSGDLPRAGLGQTDRNLTVCVCLSCADFDI